VGFSLQMIRISIGFARSLISGGFGGRVRKKLPDNRNLLVDLVIFFSNLVIYVLI